jgi:hypothetical protein
VRLLIKQAEGDALRPSADRRSDSEQRTKLRGLFDKARAAYLAAVRDEYEIATLRLTSKNDGEKSSQREPQRLQWYSAEARECAKCFHEAAQALAHPQTPPALSRCLQSLAHLQKLAKKNTPMGPGWLLRWFSNGPLSSSRAQLMQLATCG